MAQNEQYKIGYEDFLKNGASSPEYVKQQPPLWRAGYRQALIESEKRNNLSIPLVLTLVPEKTHVYRPTWSDINAATRTVRYSKLHKEHMYPLLSTIIREVEKRADEITSYAEVREYVAKAFDIILQYGYDCGILNDKDLKQYDYTPKK